MSTIAGDENNSTVNFSPALLIISVMDVVLEKTESFWQNERASQLGDIISLNIFLPSFNYLCNRFGT